MAQLTEQPEDPKRYADELSDSNDAERRKNARERKKVVKEMCHTLKVVHS